MTALAEQIDWYLNLLAARPASVSTIRTYRCELAQLERFAALRGCTSAEGLTPDLVRACAVSMMEQGRRAVAREEPKRRSKGHEAAARMMVIAARGMAEALRSNGQITVPDLKSVKTPKPPERLQPRVRAGDFERMEECLSTRRPRTAYQCFVLARERALIQLLMETGLRAVEASRLNVGDVDLETGRIEIREGKGRKPRLLGIWDPDSDDGGETIARLREYIELRAQRKGAARKSAMWLGFVGNRMSPDSLRNALANLCEEARVGGRRPPHAFRRGWFTAAYTADPSELPILSARMGWSDRTVQMVRVYTRGAMMDLASAPRPLITRTCFMRGARDR